MDTATRLFLSGALVGSGFGLALEKSKVFLPSSIQGQMALQNFVMLKVFLSATATGLIVISVLERFGKANRASRTSSLGLGLLGSYGGNVVGGLLLGSGIAVAGACPGTVFVQLASGSPSAPFVVMGTFAASVSFGYFHGQVIKRIKHFMQARPAPTLDKLFNRPAMALSFLAAAGFAAVVYLTERAFPWEVEITKLISNFSPKDNHLSLTSNSWSPITAGIMIGLVQIPSYLLSGTPLGTSSSYMTFGSRLSGLVDPKSKERAPYYDSFRNPEHLYQVGIMAGIFASSALSIFLSKPEFLHQGAHISPLQGFIGGMMLIYGARIAGGCTSGHGISGIARLSLSSIITSACMFIGGISTALLGVV